MTDNSTNDTEQQRTLPPKRSGVPFLGSAVSFARDPYTFYEDLATRGDIVRFSMGSTELAAVFHPSDIKQVLVEEVERYRKPADARGVDILSEGLLLSDGERWRQQRKRLQPLFYQDRIEAYAETMGTYAAASADEWAASDGAVDLTEVTSAYTLRVLGKTLFGIEAEKHRQAIRAGAEAIRERSSESPVAVDVPKWVPTPSNRRYQRGIAELETVINDLLADRSADTDGNDLLSLLIAATDDDGNGPTAGEIRSQLATFLFAGHETSASALTWALYELGRSPDVADRLRNEVDEVVDGPYARVPDLPALEYTEQVIQETLRRYPPAAAIFRETDTGVSLGGYRLPKDTYIVLPQFYVHTDERWWDDPLEFDPSRWDRISDPPGNRPEYAYFPFGGGPRHCIGMRFARMELKLALATIARHCHVDHRYETIDVDIGSTVSPAEPIEVRFEQRDTTGK
ncbi:cytochrome P450 [Halorubrum rutilum]|uniref:Cytochrome P450 n=1 Tax=Halorubrum rutilum TaxID=1364933 RepID=A0ABD6AP79_9EURY|nr:cytochrome P450 [Halorubrum rutilum]